MNNKIYILDIDIMPVRGFFTSQIDEQWNIFLDIDIMPVKGFCTSQSLHNHFTNTGVTNLAGEL